MRTMTMIAMTLLLAACGGDDVDSGPDAMPMCSTYDECGGGYACTVDGECSCSNAGAAPCVGECSLFCSDVTDCDSSGLCRCVEPAVPCEGE